MKLTFIFNRIECQQNFKIKSLIFFYEGKQPTNAEVPWALISHNATLVLSLFLQKI